MAKRKTFEQAKSEIKNNFNYLELLEFNGTRKIAVFIDKEFGKFSGEYRTVCSGQKNHPLRTKKYSLIKRKETNKIKYGVEFPNQKKEIMQKVLVKGKETCIKKYGKDNVFKLNKIRDKIKKTNLKNNYWHNIYDNSLKEFYLNSNISNLRSYSHVQRMYKKCGDEALNINYYDKIYGKSRSANKWINEIESKLGYSIIKEYHITKTNYHADGYDPKTNTIYEFYGNYWHGYPFKNLGINRQCDNSFNTLYYQTLDRENIIKQLGYSIISIWESEYL